MPDPELIKSIVSGGAFALLTVVTLWAMLWLTPRLLQDAKESRQEWLKTLRDQEDNCRSERAADRAAHCAALDKIASAVDRIERHPSPGRRGSSG